MVHLHMSTMIVGIVLVVVAGLFYAAFVLYGARIDGKRQKIREMGQHPVTEPTGVVHAREQEPEQNQEQTNGNQRSR
jgi:hypothetical protein